MVCRHKPGDSDCGSYERESYAASAVSQALAASTPDSSNYSIEQVERVGRHLVLMVKYPNCKNCAYEGLKCMVFLNVSEADALRWKKIDPHFRAAQSKNALITEAPSPAARFPGTPDGWKDAINYTKCKEPAFQQYWK